jgi:glycosyltransferase involved in cell wall biosynthesis
MTAEHSAPRVTIGLPVYNGDNFLRDAVVSILSQTYEDFELIVSDNASTDETEAICREYGNLDSRVRYIRHTQNRGAAPNYNFVFEQARGEYFKWAAHDDVVHPSFLERAVEALDEHPEVALVYSKVREIDEHGEVTGTYDAYEDRLRLTASEPHIRFGDMICVPHNCVGFFGLMRTSQLAKTDLHAPYEGADRTLLAEMALMGPVYRIPEYLIDRRDHPGAYTRSRQLGDRIGWWDVERVGKVTFPTWRSALEYHHAIRRVPLTAKERALCYLQFGRWLVGPRWYRQRWVRLVRDLGYGAFRLVQKVVAGRMKVRSA